MPLARFLSGDSLSDFGVEIEMGFGQKTRKYKTFTRQNKRK